MVPATIIFPLELISTAAGQTQQKCFPAKYDINCRVRSHVTVSMAANLTDCCVVTQQSVKT